MQVSTDIRATERYVTDLASSSGDFGGRCLA
jgi:hypothetical protein